MFLRQLFDQDSWTYSYLLADVASGAAVLIDPVKGQVPLYLQLLTELGFHLNYALDTHVHADHVTALGALRDATGCRTVLGQGTKAACVDETLGDGDTLDFGACSLTAIATPGHTDDSYSFFISTQAGDMVFTGDTLLIRGTGRTDFQNGCAATEYDSLMNKLLTLPDDTLVYPAHDYRGISHSTIGEERRHNPRLQVADKAAYIALMTSLKLPSPKYMDVAVPANLACGQEAGVVR